LYIHSVHLISQPTFKRENIVNSNKRSDISFTGKNFFELVYNFRGQKRILGVTVPSLKKGEVQGKGFEPLEHLNKVKSLSKKTLKKYIPKLLLHYIIWWRI